MSRTKQEIEADLRAHRAYEGTCKEYCARLESELAALDAAKAEPVVLEVRKMKSGNFGLYMNGDMDSQFMAGIYVADCKRHNPNPAHVARCMAASLLAKEVVDAWVKPDGSFRFLDPIVNFDEVERRAELTRLYWQAVEDWK